jgi:aspartate-semialdehyde dehydrogenase
MSPDARPAGLDVVLVGATTLLGQEVRRHLAQRRFPLREICMMGEGDEVGTIVEYDGEPRLVTELDPERVGRVDLLFVGSRGQVARKALTAMVQGSGVAIDLVDAEGNRQGPVINMEVNAADLPRSRPARVRSPHGIVQSLSTVLASLTAGTRLTELSATVLTPVSDSGEPGVEELYRQTAAVLNFGEQPRAVFERQVAFNAVPHALLHVQQGWPDLDARLGGEAAAVLGLPPGAVRIRAILAPVFHGNGILVSARLHPCPSAAERRERLAGSSIVVGPMTAAELGESEAIHVIDLGEEGDGRVAFWIVADNVRAGGALNGVRIAEAVFTSRRAGSGC